MSLHGKQYDLRASKHLEDGNWKTAVDMLIQSDMDYKEIMDWADGLGFYPSNEFREYVHRNTNKEALDSFFGNLNI